MAGQQQVVGAHLRHDSPPGQVPRGARLRFVASDAVGLPVKRKQVQHACLACRQKKKKCNHGPEAGNPGQVPSSISQSPEGSRDAKRPRYAEKRTDTPSSASIDIDEDASNAASHLLGLSDRAGGLASADFQEEEDPQARFVGDLNPENILISAMAEVSRNSPSSHHQRNSAVGIWKEPVQPDRNRNGRASARKPLPSAAGSDKRISSPTSQTTPLDDIATLEERLRTARNSWIERCLADIDPPQAAFINLRRIYLKKIHPIFPIFDEKRLMNLGTSRIDRAIKLVICLAASTDHEARSHLRLEAYPTTLPYQDFSSKLSQLLRALIQEIDFSNRLLDQIRILALMAMYWQPLEEQDWDGPARLFSQAMAIVFSIGLHLEVYDKAYHIHDQHEETPAGHPPRQRCREDIERIFLCIFALDRLMASFYGRPILLNERDFDRDILKYAAMQAPCFRLFILVIWQLNLIQDLYRPFSTSQLSAEVSVFERLILESGAQNAPPFIIATIEVFHHAVCALSVRQTRQAFANPPAAGPNHQQEYPHLPQPLLNARRSISADRILQIVKQYDVGPLPFIPYALSISLSVAYRKWRFSQIPMFRARGRAAFMEVLLVLEKWAGVFTSARINYNLAQKVVEGMEKVQDNIKRKCRDGTPAMAPIRDQLKSAMAGANTNGISSSQTPAGQSSSLVTDPPSLVALNGNGEHVVGTLPRSSVESLPVSFPAPDPRALSFNYDFSFPEDLAGLDLFNFFDESTMDVGEMDSMFDRNLDPMAPAFWPAYPSLDPERIDQGAAFFP
ncbi:hypothetical protein BR93DRAFT_960752 [Coniochaeta sp. PMI_546]|nr:hypothetical protein BR93DRAFT_960752 [Coniochaeta sp. PMI_546]